MKRSKQVLISSLVADPDNVRVHGARNMRAIKASLERFGQQKPIVVNEAGKVVAGNGTLAAALELGWKRIAVVVTDLEDEEAAAFAIADNRTAELATWDEEGLTRSLEGLDDAARAAAGFTGAEVRKMSRALLAGDGPKLDTDGNPIELGGAIAPPKNPISQPGDLILLGDHRLKVGDTFDDDDRAELLDGVEVAMVATDPPYAIYGSSTGIASDIADDKMVQPFFRELSRVLFEVLPVFGHAYTFCDWRSWAAIWTAFRGSGLTGKNLLVWDKCGAGLGNAYANTHELVGFWAKLPPRGTMTGKQRTGQRPVLRPNVLRYPRPTGDARRHNAAKPVPLMAELVENSSDEGAWVLDLFGGSGSTLLAAEQTNRRCAIMEMEPAFADVIVTRWEELTGAKATRPIR